MLAYHVRLQHTLSIQILCIQLTWSYLKLLKNLKYEIPMYLAF